MYCRCNNVYCGCDAFLQPGHQLKWLLIQWCLLVLGNAMVCIAVGKIIVLNGLAAVNDTAPANTAEDRGSAV